MLAFHPQQYRILDFYEWHRRDELKLQPKFQRRPGWKDTARSYLIDTILRGLPIPKLFLREQTDVRTKRTIREVVDGQQRLKAVLDFIEGKLIVAKNHNESYWGRKFEELPDEVQERFFSYRVSVDLLEGATDRDVLNVFSRLNSYTLSLNAQEKLNAEFFGPFKQTIYDLGLDHYSFWLGNNVLTDREIARMAEAQLVSELVIAMLDGLQQGTTSVRSFYKRYDEEFPLAERAKTEFRSIIDLLSETFADALKSTRFRRRPLLYSLFCVFYDARFGIPKSNKHRIRFSKQVTQSARNALLQADSQIDWSNPQPEYVEFVTACGKGTAFLRYRQIRHDFIWNCLFGHR